MRILLSDRFSPFVAPKFGDFDYETGGGAYESDWVTIEQWTDEPSYRGSVTPVPRSDVARVMDGLLGPRTITIRGILGPDGGGTREELRIIEDAFRWAHRPGYRALYRDEDRYVRAEVRSLTLGEDQGLSWIPFSVRFEAADPYWYATAADTNTWTAPASGATQALGNYGFAPALPKFTLTVGATGTLALDLYNDTVAADHTFGLDGTVTAGDVLVVDCYEQTVTLNGGNKMSYFSGDFFSLAPGSNTLRLVLSGVTLTSIQTEWTKRWL